MPDFGRWTANGGDPSLNDINRADKFLDALASEQPPFSTDPGDADHVELGDLANRIPDLPVGPTVVMCGHGERAMSAASLLARAGHRDVSVMAGGPQDWADAAGAPLEVRA